MKKTAPFIIFLLVLSCLSGYFMSKASLVGRVGISLFYKQYSFLKTWWQGALVVFVAFMIIFLLQGIGQKKLPQAKAILLHVIMIAIALTGLYFTYSDFRQITTHRWLGERFHIGGYLFWTGWIFISLYYIFRKKTEALPIPIEPETVQNP
jgi:uncharacterized membrane protein YhhN